MRPRPVSARRSPRPDDGHVMGGGVAGSSGAREIEQSCQSARSALALSPKLAEAHWRLAITLRGRLPDTEVQAIERLINDPSLPAGAVAFLRFGLAAVLDERGLYSQAAAKLETANALQSGVLAAMGRSHDPEGDAWFVNRMIAAFHPDLFARGRGWVGPDPRPVFVVGLQRSGTSSSNRSSPLIRRSTARRATRCRPCLSIAARSRRSHPRRLVRRLEIPGPVSAKAAARIFLERLDALDPHGRARHQQIAR